MSLNGYYKLRYRVLERDNFTCQLCGQKAPNAKLEVDHITPRSEGGSDDMENLRTTCFACNHGRGSFTVENHKQGTIKQGSKEKPDRKLPKVDEAVYRVLMKWRTTHAIRDICHWLPPLSEDMVMAALVRLNKRGLAYRTNDSDREWYAMDRYSLEYKLRRQQ